MTRLRISSLCPLRMNRSLHRAHLCFHPRRALHVQGVNPLEPLLLLRPRYRVLWIARIVLEHRRL